jgi:hypothetical protein
VSCVQATDCAVTCEGSCTVTCTQAKSCKVECAGGTTGCNLYCGGTTMPTACADGKSFSCGAVSC